VRIGLVLGTVGIRGFESTTFTLRLVCISSASAVVWDWLTKPGSILYSHRFDMFTTASLCDMEHQPSIEDKDLRLGFDEPGASVRWPIHPFPHYASVANTQPTSHPQHTELD